MSTDAFMAGLRDTPADDFADERLLVVRVVAVVLLGLMIGGLCLYAVGPDTRDPAVRATLPAVDVGFAQLLEERRDGLASFTARYSGHLFRLQGVVSRATAEPAVVWQDGSRQRFAPLVVISAQNASPSYVATFLPGEAAAISRLEAGTEVSIICNHLEVMRSQRMEGCTLASAISPLPARPHPGLPPRPPV